MLNINELREILSEQLQKLREGKGNVKEAQSVCKLSHEMCNTYRLEMSYYKTAGKRPEMASFLPPPAKEDDEAGKQH